MDPDHINVKILKFDKISSLDFSEFYVMTGIQKKVKRVFFIIFFFATTLLYSLTKKDKICLYFKHSSRESSQVNTARSHSSNEDEYIIEKQKMDLQESTNPYKSVHRESGTNTSSKKTTLDDLFNSLKELEEEPIFSKSKKHGAFNAGNRSFN